MRLSLDRWIALGSFCLPAFALVFLTFSLADPFRSSRSILIEAESLSIQILFQGSANRWDLGQVVICHRRERLDASLSPGEGDLCDPRRYTTEKRDLVIAFPERSSVSIVDRGTKGFSLQISDVPELPRDPLIFLSRDALHRIGTLSFIGEMVLGQTALSGEAGLLLSGNYEIREVPLFRSGTETIKSGPLRRGDSVRMLAGDVPALTWGHISRHRMDDERGMHVVGTSASGSFRLEISYFGGKQPILISPSWVDRALSSPILLASLFLVSIGTGQVQLIVAGLDRWRQSKAPRERADRAIKRRGKRLPWLRE